MSMTKQEIIKTIAKSAAITLKEAEQAVNTLVDLLVDEVKTEGRFALAGVGVFTLITRAAKTGRNPRNGEPIKIAEKKAVKFKPAVSFKETVNR